MAIVETRAVTKVFKAGTLGAVNDVDLVTEEGEFLVFLGPSGSGKTTLLRMIAGLEVPTSGDILIGGEVVNDLTPRERRIAMVFQSYALYPHLSVYKNIAFPLKAQNVPKEQHRKKVEWAAGLLSIGHLLERKPRELSGGQQQRVALARALATEPGVLLLDEPLSNLDALLREEMRVELKRLQERLGTTMIFVTHDQAEALILSDRVAVMQGGRVEQVGRPEDVYRRPATPFVARFLGRANFLHGSVAGTDAGRLVIALDGGLSIAAAAQPAPASGQRVAVAIRQENIRIAPAGAGAGRVNRFDATVVFHAFAGQAHHYVVQLADGRELEIAAPGASLPLARGAQAIVEWEPEDAVVVADGDTGVAGSA